MPAQHRFTGRQITTMVVAGCATVVLAPVGVFAATGGSLLLGKANTATAPTSLTNTGSGAALRLATNDSSAPPFTVGGDTTKVPDLNADLLDGLDGRHVQRVLDSACPGERALRSVARLGAVTCTPEPFRPITAKGSFVVPAGVTRMFVDAWGAGGGGGQGANGSNGGGGGSGGHERELVTVAPGEVFDVVIGTGGAGGSAGNSGHGQAGTVTKVSRHASHTLVAGATAGGGGMAGQSCNVQTTPGGSFGSTQAVTASGVIGLLRETGSGGNPSFTPCGSDSLGGFGGGYAVVGAGGDGGLGSDGSDGKPGRPGFVLVQFV